MVGISQVQELGVLEAPIALTNTLAVGPVMRGVVDLVLQQNPSIDPISSINAVVGEVNDGRINRIHNNSISSEDVKTAFANRQKDFLCGSVGAGTGARCFSWKGGIGTASRKVGDYTVGALVQTNYGGNLTIMGVPIGTALGKTDYDSFIKDDGSCMIVLATDAPVDARQLQRIANRGSLALARTGAVLANTSGDYTVAFSVNKDGRFAESAMTNLFLAAVESIEEAIYDALFLAKTMEGRDGRALEELPKEQVIEILKRKL